MEDKEIELIAQLIQDLDALPSGDTQALDAVQRRGEMVIRNVFGDTSHYIDDLWRIEFWSSVPTFHRPNRPYYPNKTENDAAWRAGVGKMRNLFETMLEECKNFPKQRMDEAASKLAAIRAGLDRKAQRAAQLGLWLYFGLLVLLWVCSGIAVYFLDWNLVEPWVWFITGGFTVVSAAYFVVTHKELSPMAIYRQIVEAKRQKLYREFGVE